MITVCRSRLPKRRLLFQCGDDAGIVEDIHGCVESTEPCLMGKQLSEGDLALAGLRKFRPELGDATR